MAFGLSTSYVVSTINAQGSLRRSQRALEKNVAHLSSGRRINSASEGGSDLAKSVGLQADIRAMSTAKTNASEGLSALQAAKSGVEEIESVLEEMKSLAEQAADSSTDSSERQDLNSQFQDLDDKIQQIVNNTDYDNEDLLNGEFDEEYQVGTHRNDSIEVGLSKDMDRLFANFSAMIHSAGSGAQLGTATAVFGGSAGHRNFSFDIQGATTEGTLYTFAGQSGGIVTTKTFSNGFANPDTSGRTVRASGTEFSAGEAFSAQFTSGERVLIKSNGKIVSWWGFTGDAGSINTENKAEKRLAYIDDALKRAKDQRQHITDKINRFEDEVNTLTNRKQTLEDANSNLLDVNRARESAKRNENEIRTQAAQSILTQANIFHDVALGLVEGSSINTDDSNS